jgi:broad specificity phosphatase PhoE
MAVEVVLVQHAEKQRVPGDSPLTASGRHQARNVARSLASEGWDQLLCSPLLRAQQTALPIGDAVGLCPVVDDRLRERMNWGDSEFTQSIEEFLRDWDRASRDRTWRPPAGSSSIETGERMRSVLDDVVAQGFRERSQSPMAAQPSTCSEASYPIVRLKNLRRASSSTASRTAR